ncbi:MULTISPECIES: hypothetical protein [unclassified Paenibacillus]|uniref:hypothetical protein n=1 Tax=unclassified Paenibacillus TaxID=185978 RepID=UPI001AE30789|nr:MULTISPECIES: hypothetical protein [unclassified Paenibacillus]MBP1155711.1 hypothetical protein [Paenibacillus sp. PvP091]MBP1168903.1 hypothetical protein [Paenibacillus sp. PvR098]MBP2439931.1 hypothetical protein [Paenibacillus sp. PvP052]
MKDQTTIEFVHNEFDWKNFLHNNHFKTDLTLFHKELDDRKEDLSELRWLLLEIRRVLELYRGAFPHGQFERELRAAFTRQADVLEKQVAGYETKLEECDLNAYLAVKYEIRTLFKQLGAIVAGSDWQSPCKRLKNPPPDVPEEAGFAQEEQGTYMRSYGSETVKEYEEASLAAFYSLSADIRKQSVGFLTTSGMKALELALIAYKTFTRETLPFYYQKGFYCEGVDLAKTLMITPLELDPAEIYMEVEANKPIGCLLVDPGMCWPVRPAVDLARLFEGLSCHKQSQPLYVIVDRTLTSVANPLFERYADRLPPHVVLISVESGIKYMQYGLELANVGYLVAVGRTLRSESHREKWVALLSLLDAGADPLTVRQLPAPDLKRLTARLSRLNRNAYWMDAFLSHMAREGKVAAFYRSVEPSSQYDLNGRNWIGSVFYIQLPGHRSEQEYQAWIDDFVVSSPEEVHFVSGGSFGFDTFRMNAVGDVSGKENALRVSVGRDPLGQLLLKLKYMYSYVQP